MDAVSYARDEQFFITEFANFVRHFRMLVYFIYFVLMFEVCWELRLLLFQVVISDCHNSMKMV